MSGTDRVRGGASLRQASLRAEALFRAGALLLVGAVVLAGAPSLAGQERPPSPRIFFPAEAPARGWLGIEVASFSAAGDADAGGILVRGIHPGGPADRAGVRSGDVIVRVRGEGVSGRTLGQVLQGLEPGERVPLTLRREGESRMVEVEAAERPAFYPTVLPEHVRIRADSIRHQILVEIDSLDVSTIVRLRGPAPLGGGRTVLRPLRAESMVAGAELTRLNPDLGRYFGLDEGVLVTEVVPESPASDAGLEPGDVVVEVEGEPVTGVDELLRRVEHAWRGARRGEGGVALAVVREGRRLEVYLSR